MDFSVVFIILIPIAIFYIALCWPQKKDKVKSVQKVTKATSKVNITPSKSPSVKKDGDINLF